MNVVAVTDGVSVGTGVSVGRSGVADGAVVSVDIRVGETVDAKVGTTVSVEVSVAVGVEVGRTVGEIRLVGVGVSVARDEASGCVGVA